MSEPRMVIRHPGEGPSVSVVGDLYRFLAEGGDTGGRFSIWHATIPPGGGPPPHLHRRESEAFYILSGTLTFYVLDENQVQRCGPGSFVHLPPDRPHRFANESSQVVECLILAVPAGIEEMFRQVGTASDIPLPMTPEQGQRLLQAAPGYGLEIL